MIHEVKGDILKSKAQAIAHGVAPNDHFTQGLALALRELWPSLQKDFRHYYQSHHPKSGEMWAWVNSRGQHIVNLFTQEPAKDHQSNPGKASLQNLNHSLKELRKYLDKNKIKSVALPRIATGVGGLNWDDVQPLLSKHLGDYEGHVYLYVVYQKDVSANET